MPALSIIIPTKDRGEIFFKTLETIIAASAHIDAEIIVINNSLIPVTIPSIPRNVLVRDNPGNKNSVFASRNFGASIAQAPYLLFIDDDILVSKESIDYIMDFNVKHPSSCTNVNWQYPPELISKAKHNIFVRYLIKHGFTSMKTLFGKQSWNENEPFRSTSLASFFFSILKSDFVRIGGYEERHLHEGTDTDISNKLNLNGIAIWINPKVMVYHNEADRIEISNWLERKKRVGQIYAYSATISDNANELHYSPFKRFIFGIAYFLQPLVLLTIKILGAAGLDSLAFYLINGLLGANMCHGYFSVKK